jgi:peptidyl-prolyl cis-trans isomerase D
VVQFGPQSRGCGRGKLSTEFVARVYGYAIAPDAWRWAWVMHNGSQMQAKEAKAMRLRESVMDGLIERELLVHEAEKLSLRVTEEDVEDALLDNKLFMTSSVHAMGRASSSGVIPIDFTRDDGSFDFENFQMFVTNRFHLTLASFKEQQVREMAAQHMRLIMESAVRVSEIEVQAEYEANMDRAKVGYVTFDPAFYIRRLDPTNAEIKAWVDEHADEVKKKYDDESYKYTNVERQVGTSHILIKVDDPVDDEEVAKKKALAEEILNKAKGGANFGKLAREYSDDEMSAKQDGLIGYRSRGQLVEAYEDVAYGLEVGEIAGPVKTQFGFHIIRCDGFREGDIPFEDVKEEIGRTLMLLTTAREQAQQAADALLEKVKAGASLAEAAGELEAVYFPPEEPAKKKPLDDAEESEEAESEEAESEEEEEKQTDPLMPRYKESSWVQNGADSVPGIGKDEALMEELFGLDENNPLVDHVVTVGDRWFVLQLSERMKPTDDDYAIKKPDIKRYLEGEKKISMFTQWMDDLRAKAEQAGALEINKAYLNYGIEPTEDEAAAEAEKEKAD